MKGVFVGFLLMCFMPSVVLAGVGDTDNRYYVTDEMWAQEPYKKFVYLAPGLFYNNEVWKKINETDENLTKVEEETFQMIGNCSAQYISPNLILSAGHCIITEDEMQEIVSQYTWFNNNPHRGYRVKNHKNENFYVKLVDTEYKGAGIDTLGDWAVWLVTDPQYYSDAYFDIKVPTKTVDVINAGWGWARIFSDEELEDIRKIYMDIALAIMEENENLEDKTKKQGTSISDLKNEISRKLTKPLTDKPNKLKASDCQIIFEDCSNIHIDLLKTRKNALQDNITEKKQTKLLKSITKKEERFKNMCNDQKLLKHASNYPNILATTCDSWGGNSGGGYVSSDGKYLYGTCSYGVDDFENEYNSDYIVSAKQFDKRIKELIKKYDSNNPVEDNIAKIPTNLYGDVPGSKDRTTEQRMLKRSNLFNLEELEEELTNAMPNIQNMSNAQLLKFLDKLAEHEDKTKRLEELQKAYEEAKSREQSTANKMLTAATMAATGIGGMQLAQGLAEQKADEEAETAMRAYLATFTCEYGGGRIAGGTQNVELPGTNLLTPLIMEYKELAADLKARKEALGMAPGIESEVVLDAAMVGLHNDVNTGKTSGAYTSLARALSGDADAAAAWDAQKQESAQKVKTGAAVGGVGAAGGAVGNAIINGKSGEK